MKAFECRLVATLLLAITFQKKCCAFMSRPSSVRSTFFGRQEQVVRHVFNRRVKESPTTLSDNSQKFQFWRNEQNKGNEAKDPMVQTTPMGDLVHSLRSDDERKDLPQEHSSHTKELENQTLLLGSGALALLLSFGLGIAYSLGLSPADAVGAFERLLANPQESLQDVVDSVQAMGPAGLIYFGLIYLVAEILAVPATPLTLSAGYLFGMVEGVAVVLLAATIAASVAFVIGKTFLRSWVEGVLEENPKFAKIDEAVGQQGFKLLLLVRLSPIFPFALSNYLYGASSIDFASYFWGTLLGFTPGTIAYVYTGMVGKALTLGEGSQPWYVYAGGLGLLAVFLKLVTDVASDIVNHLDDDEELTDGF